MMTNHLCMHSQDKHILCSLFVVLFMMFYCSPVTAISTETQKLIATDGAFDDRYGQSVSVSGNYAIVGAWGDDDPASQAGSAYIYEYLNGNWVELIKLNASDAEYRDRFGISVAISNDTAIVGAYSDDDKGTDSGSAYVFERHNGVWAEAVKLTASDGAGGDYFGRSVAISDNLAVVGSTDDDDNGLSSGSAYIFEKKLSGWVETEKLIGSDGAAGDNFGHSVAISGEIAVIGAPYADDIDDVSGTINTRDVGAAYIFKKQGGGWIEAQKITDLSSTDFRDVFGVSVAISGNSIVIGEEGDDQFGFNRGAVHFFEKQAGTWTGTLKTTASDTADQDFLGSRVGISGATALVASISNNQSTGTAYVFQKRNGNWIEVSKLIASDGSLSNQLGVNVAISGNTALLGASYGDGNVADSGAAYVYDLSSEQPDVTTISPHIFVLIHGWQPGQQQGGDSPMMPLASAIRGKLAAQGFQENRDYYIVDFQWPGAYTEKPAFDWIDFQQGSISPYDALGYFFDQTNGKHFRFFSIETLELGLALAFKVKAEPIEFRGIYGQAASKAIEMGQATLSSAIENTYSNILSNSGATPTLHIIGADLGALAGMIAVNKLLDGSTITQVEQFTILSDPLGVTEDDVFNLLPKDQVLYVENYYGNSWFDGNNEFSFREGGPINGAGPCILTPVINCTGIGVQDLSDKQLISLLYPAVIASDQWDSPIVAEFSSNTPDIAWDPILARNTRDNDDLSLEWFEAEVLDGFDTQQIVGQVGVLPDGSFQFTTNSPSSMTMDVMLPDSFQALRFQYQLDPTVPSVLSIYSDGDLLWTINSTSLLSTNFNESILPAHHLSGRINQLTFELNNLTGTQANATVKAIQFESVVPSETIGQTDSDGDGLSNSKEAAIGTDPLDSDTDNDGLTDANEYNTHNTNPLDSDTDGDLLSDGDEINVYATSPFELDSDADGAQDGVEAGAGTDPVNFNSWPTVPVGDISGDGIVDVRDVLMSTKIIFDLMAPLPYQANQLDVAPLVAGTPQPDGNSNAGDLALILRKAIGSLSF